MSGFCFNEKKATQLASAFIERNGGSMNHMKLMKLMYMADRTALLRWYRPITGDDYYSLKHGPILSATLSMISDGANPDTEKFWFNYITKSGDYEVSLAKDCPRDDLSEAEEEIVDEVFEQYGKYAKWDLVNHLHATLPEWQDPGSSSFPISVQDILKAGGKSSEEIASVENEVKDIAFARAVFGCN